MNLQLIYGGKIHPLQLDDGEHRVGRAGDNDVKIPVGRVSKHHAVVRIDGDRLFVKDLGSSNGTTVDGEPVGGEELEVLERAQIDFAGAVLRRVLSPSKMSHTLVDEKDVSTQIRYNIKQGFSEGARDRILDKSAELFELLASGSDAMKVAEAACEFVANVVTADRVVLLEDEGEGTSIEAKAQWPPVDDETPLQLSSTIVREVMSERDSVLVANPLDDTKYAGQQSIMALNLRSAMAAPLFDNERVRGILYVDTAKMNVQYSKDDLEVLSAAANAVAVKIRNLSYEREMQTAANIQRSMLPENPEAPAGYELEAYQVMCRAVGGDLYHCIRRPNGHVLLVLGDVAGKGIPAALAMTAATVLISMLAEIGGELKDMATHLHRHLYASLAPEQFITLFLAELDETTGELRYVNAGQEPPLVIRADGQVDELDSTGMPVAMIEDLLPVDAEATLHPGDLLAVFSDGVPEATTDGDSFLGMDPVRKILTDQSTAPLPSIREKIVTTVADFLGGGHNSDDLTLLLLRRNP